MAATLMPRIRETRKCQPEAVPVKKAVPARTPTERHKQRNADKRDKFPKRPKRGARPFETTLDF